MSPFELEHVYPWLNTDGLALGSLGVFSFSPHTLDIKVFSGPSSLYIGMENEGWFDPYLLLSAFKQKIISLGVQYVHGDIDGLKIDNQLVRKVEVIQLRFPVVFFSFLLFSFSYLLNYIFISSNFSDFTQF